jgi:phage-related holin
MVQKKSKSAGRSFQTAGAKLDDVLGDASKRIEEETKTLIAYINNELVPAIREHSSNGMRMASEKLKQAADMMDAGKKQKKG